MATADIITERTCTPVQEAASDGPLLALVARWERSMAAREAADAEAMAAYRRMDAPTVPVALLRQATDGPLVGLMTDPPAIGEDYQLGAVNQLRCRLERFETATDNHPFSWMSKASAGRAQEIVEAYDEWLGQYAAAETEAGVDKAEKAAEEATTAHWQLRAEIAGHPARTLPGVLAKVALVDSEICAFEPDRLYTIDALAMSVLRDLVGLMHSAGA
jgi:hypothetical protein